MNKEEQKKLITEIMNEDAKDGLYEPAKTAVEWLLYHFDEIYHIKDKFLPSDWEFLEETSKAMEKEQSFTEQNIQDAYNTGYADAQTNHINDVNNYISELRYIRSK